jgi:hypothetical protein
MEVADMEKSLYPEDGGSKFFQKAGINVPNYTASYPRRKQS